jgi:uncharacterized protein (DUF2235 family)
MSKRLIVCCDGTWNSADDENPTNVSKIALAVAAQDGTGKEQRTYYHRGVGTDKRERVRGGAFGVGLSRDVRNAYRFLVDNYEPGDDIYFFGFSRGAFTARSTAGFVGNCGVLRREHTHRLDEAYALYRNKSKTTMRKGTEAILFRRAFSHEPHIEFIGVFDTVGSLGIPLHLWNLTGMINRRWAFHDTTLSPTVRFAYHALAIDEKRRPFRPTLWTPDKDAAHGPIDPPPQDRKVEQVWFAGVHKDVGGGYEVHGLSDISLLWMVDRARERGVGFRPDSFAERSSREARRPGCDETLRAYTAVNPNTFGKLNESRKGFFKIFPGYSRRFGEGLPGTEYLSSTAEARYDRNDGYAPRGLVDYLEGAPQVMPVR